MVEKIGLEAVLLDENFKKGLSNFVKGVQQMSGSIDSVEKTVGASSKKITGDLDKMGSEAEKSGKRSQGASKDWMKSFVDIKAGVDLAMMAFNKVMQGLEKFYAAVKEGAQIELVAGKFDRLATGIGAVSDALLTDLRKATKGTVSDLQLMASATDFMSLGLAKSHAEVVRLTAVAGALGMNMNQLVLTLTNKTTMRFDALGVAVDGFDERLQTLEDTGMSVNDAFTEAFLQQAEEQIDKVGEIADTTAGDLMKLEASWANLTNAIKESLATTIGPAISLMADWAMVNQELARAVDAGTLSYIQAIGIKQRMIWTDTDMVDVLEELNALTETEVEIQEEVTEAVYQNIEGFGALGKTFKVFNVRGKDTIWTYERLYSRADDLVNINEELKHVQDKVNQGMKDLQLFIAGPLGKEMESYKLAQADVNEQIGITVDKINELGGMHYQTPEQITQVSGLKSQLTGVIIKIIELQDEIDNDKLKGKNLVEAKSNLEDLEIAAGDLENQIIRLGGLPYRTKEQDGQLLDLQAKLKDLKQQYADNADAHEDATKRILFDLTAQRLALGGLTEAEFAFLQALALEWDLIDQDTYDYVTNLEEWLGDATLSWDGLLDKVQAYSSTLGNIPSYIYTTVMVQYLSSGGVPTPEGTTTTPSKTAPGGPSGSKQTGETGTEGTQGTTGDAEKTKEQKTAEEGKYSTEGMFGFPAAVDVGQAVTDRILGKVLGNALLQVNETLEGLMDIGSQLGSFGSAFSSRYSERYLMPLQEELAALDEQLKDADPAASWANRTILERRAQLTEQIAEAEGRILGLQQQQQDLDFLRQQMDMLEFVKEQGLDPAEIFKGFEFGLDASLPGLMDIISNAMQMVIDQANETLGIASPSKVFAGIAENILGSMAGTIESMSYAPVQATQLAMSRVTSVASAMSSAPLAAGSISRTMNVNFGGVNMSGGMDVAVLENTIRGVVRSELGTV